MKNLQPLVAAIVLATASLGSSSAFAQDVSSPPQALALIDNSAFFGDAFGMNNQNDTFTDQFTFSITNTVPQLLDAVVASASRTSDTGLDITGLALYQEGGTLLNSGTLLRSGATDVWSLAANNLDTGSYYLQVSGTMVSNTAAAFGGSMMLVPVPEPEAYGMMLAGLGLVGWMARRRSKQP